MKLTFGISILLAISLSANVNAQIDPRNVNITKEEVHPKPVDDKCYEPIETFVRDEYSPKKDSITFSKHRRRINNYIKISSWQSFVCEEDLSLNFYEVLLAAFKEKGYQPKNTYPINPKSYEHDIKMQAMSCFHNYHFLHKLKGDKISIMLLDSLGIQLDKLDELVAHYNITPPTLKEQMIYKVYIDIDKIDSNGLKKSESGLMPVTYNYLIPNKPEYISELKNIDPSFQLVNIPKEKMALIGAEMGYDDAVFATGSTNQANYLEILYQLIELEYIYQIHEVKAGK